MLCDDLAGGVGEQGGTEPGEDGDICIHKADSFCRAAW